VRPSRLVTRSVAVLAVSPLLAVAFAGVVPAAAVTTTRPAGQLASLSISGGFHAVAATSAGNAWAVGYAGSFSSMKPLIAHWNGTSWSRVASPGATGSTLNGVAAVSARSVWAVGGTFSATSQSQALVERWNGQKWQQVHSPAQGNGLSSVSAAAANNVWAVGLGGSGGGYLILHWNGSSLKQVAIPKFSGYLPFPSAVATTSASNAWVVGSDSKSRTLIEHWTGSSWTRQASPSGTLSAVTATSKSSAWAVGNTSSGKTLTLRWNGSAWR
jgi:hypothetical protein